MGLAHIKEQHSPDFVVDIFLAFLFSLALIALLAKIHRVWRASFSSYNGRQILKFEADLIALPSRGGLPAALGVLPVSCYSQTPRLAMTGSLAFQRALFV